MSPREYTRLTYLKLSRLAERPTGPHAPSRTPNSEVNFAQDRAFSLGFWVESCFWLRRRWGPAGKRSRGHTSVFFGLNERRRQVPVVGSGANRPPQVARAAREETPRSAVPRPHADPAYPTTRCMERVATARPGDFDVRISPNFIGFRSRNTLLAATALGPPGNRP